MNGGRGGEGGHGGNGKGGHTEGHSTAGDHRGERAGESAAGRRSAVAEAAAAAYSQGIGRVQERAQTVESLAKKAFTSQEPGPQNHVPVKNADCGPAALATAMKALHEAPFNANVGREIARNREEMTGAENHQQPTSPHEVAAAARLNGLKAVTITGLKQINEALAQHKVVVQLGEPGHMMNGVNFAGTHPAKVNTMEHFVTVLGHNPITGKYTVDSSERRGPEQVTTAQMRAFITRDTGTFQGVALSNDRSRHSTVPTAKVGPDQPVGVPESSSKDVGSPIGRNSPGGSNGLDFLQF